MDESLDEKKRGVTARFVGQAGIHGVGIQQSQNAIRLYVDGEETAERRKILDEITKYASPFQVLVIQSKSSKLLDSDR